MSDLGGLPRCKFFFVLSLLCSFYLLTSLFSLFYVIREGEGDTEDEPILAESFRFFLEHYGGVFLESVRQRS